MSRTGPDVTRCRKELQLPQPQSLLTQDTSESRAVLHRVAKLHYDGGMSQVAIARHLGVSTATVSRLLTRARSEGIVRIEVRDLVEPDVLGERLRDQLGLRQVQVIDAPAAALPSALATPLARVLTDAGLGPNSVVAIGWGRAIRAVLEGGLPPLPGVQVVPATGGLQQHAPHFQINEFVRRAAGMFGGTPHFIHAPYLPSAAARDSFLSDPAIATSVALWDRIDVAILGVGLPPALTPPEASVATASEQAIIGAAGDVIRHYIDVTGRIIPWDGESRMIAVAPSQLRKARLSVGVACGPAKAAAILGAARSGLISALVTDVLTAEAMLERVRAG